MICTITDGMYIFGRSNLRTIYCLCSLRIRIHVGFRIYPEYIFCLTCTKKIIFIFSTKQYQGFNSLDVDSVPSGSSPLYGTALSQHPLEMCLWTPFQNTWDQKREWWKKRYQLNITLKICWISHHTVNFNT